MRMITNRGFTLIEMLLYAAIFTIVAGGMTVFAVAMLQSAEQTDYRVEVSDNTRFLVQKMQRVIQGATVINSPAVGGTSSSLSVNTASTSANPFVVYASGGILLLKMASATPVPLTNSFVTVSSLSFRNYDYGTTTKNTIRFRAKVESINPIHPASSSIDIFISRQ